MIDYQDITTTADWLQWIKEREDSIFVRVQTDGRAHNARLSNLEPRAWAEHVAGWLERGIVPCAVKSTQEEWIRIHAPWDAATVLALDAYQKSGWHPYTCGEPDCPGRSAEHHNVLVPTGEGWRCPYCPYTQDWCFNGSVEIGKSTREAAGSEKGREEQ